MFASTDYKSKQTSAPPLFNKENHSSSTVIIIIFQTSKLYMFHAKLGSDVCPMYEVPSHIPEYCPFEVQPKQFDVISPQVCLCPHFSPLPPTHLYY